MPLMKFGSMKIAPSKGKFEFVDGARGNQYPFNTKSRLKTFHWVQARQTIRRPTMDGEKPRKNSTNIYFNARHYYRHNIENPKNR